MDPPETLPSKPENDLILFYLVTSISLFGALIPSIVSLLLNLLIWDSQMEKSLKRQASDLKEELGSISMTDEFAKYSKIQRKYLKITDELRNKSNQQLFYHTRTKMILYAILYLISTILFSVVNWRNYRKPVMFFSPGGEHHIFYPFGSVLSFPTGQPDCLSVPIWFFLSGYSFRILARHIF